MSHFKCENIDPRGFDMKKAAWRCVRCSGEGKDNTIGNQTSSNLRNDHFHDAPNLNTIEATNLLIDIMDNLNQMKATLDEVLMENKKLRMEIFRLKESDKFSLSPDPLSVVEAKQTRQNYLLNGQPESSNEISDVPLSPEEPENCIRSQTLRNPAGKSPKKTITKKSDNGDPNVRKAAPSKQQKKPLIIGNGPSIPTDSGEEFSIARVIKRSTLHVTRINPRISEDDVINYMWKNSFGPLLYLKKIFNRR